jgi:hypothetical protein
MEAIPTKIIATPEAYQLLNSPTDSDKVQRAVRQAFLAATNQRDSPLTDYYIVNCPISLHGRLTETPEGKVFTILLYSNKGKGAMFFIYDELYQAAFDSAVPVELV